MKRAEYIARQKRLRAEPPEAPTRGRPAHVSRRRTQRASNALIDFPSRTFAVDNIQVPVLRKSRPALPMDRSRGLVLADPTLHPYRARGIGDHLGVFAQMIASDPILAGSVGLIGRETSRAAWVIEMPSSPTPDEVKAHDLGVKFLGLNGENSFLRGGLPKLVRIMANNRTTYGFAPFERIWEKKIWRGEEVLVPSRVYQIPPSSVWGWLWDDETGDLQGLIQERTFGTGMSVLSPHYFHLASAGIPGSAIFEERLLLHTQGDEDQNPEGRSMVRPAWIYWNAKKDTLLRHQEGQENLFGGVTTLEEIANPKTGRHYDTDSVKDLVAFDETIGQWRDQDLDYMFVPLGYKIKNENPAIKVPSPRADMEYFDRQMALTFAAQLIGSTGSSSMGASAAQMTFNAIDAIAKGIAEDITGRTGVPFSGLLNQLYLCNIEGASDPAFRSPKLTPIGIEFQDAKAWIDAISKASQFMLLHYDAGTEQRIRARTGLPPLTSEEMEQREIWAERRLESQLVSSIGSNQADNQDDQEDEDRASEEGTQAPILPPDEANVQDPDEV